MRVFVSEFVCGGGWPCPALPASLAREGRAMLAALVEDLTRCAGCQVVTTWDARLGDCPLRDCEVHIVESPTAEATLFRELCCTSDVVWIIAPETDGELFKRTLQFRVIDRAEPRSPPRRLIGASDDAIELTSDKLPLATWLLERAIATPETLPFNPVDRQAVRWPTGTVIKRRDGAGSQDMFLVRDGFELWNARHALGRLDEPETFVQQPFVPGRAISVTLLIADDGTLLETFPAAEQHLSEDGHFKYLGGRIPAAIDAQSTLAAQRLAERTARTLTGLTGYVGFDLVLPDSAPHAPVLIEINPRLTSSYLGYRQLTNDNIPKRLLDAGSNPLQWKPDTVTFVV